MWRRVIYHIFTLGIPAIIDAIARNARKRREQEARLEREKKKKNDNSGD
jgi:hypothetical protein